MSDNIIEFPDKQELHVEVTFDDADYDAVDDIFYGLIIMLRGMTADDEVSYGDCVDGCIMAAAWSAKQAGYSADDLMAVFQSVKVNDTDA